MKAGIRGIHPYSIIKPDYESPIWQASVPPVAIVPLLQHQGGEAVPLVQKGDMVTEGLLIGEAPVDSGTGVHSPIPGKVEEIIDLTLPSGQTCKAVKISLEGQFEYLGKEKDNNSWEKSSPLSLINIIAQKGIVHMDGFTEPLAGMLRELCKYGAESLVVNAASGAPFVSNELRLLSEQPQKLITGLSVLRRILGIEDVWLVYSRLRRKHVQAFKKAAAAQGISLRVRAVQETYPGGDPYELIHMVSRSELLPSADFSATSVGVFSVSTIFAVFEAVVYRKPLIDRLVTLGGGAIGKSWTVRVRIGTPLWAIFQEIGGLQRPAEKILLGNPLQGYEVADSDTPVTKEVTGIMALTREELGLFGEQPCIHCGICVDTCPSGIEPVVLHKLLIQNKTEEAVKHGLLACRICGICSHVCPSHIPLTGILRDGIVRTENIEGTAREVAK